MATLVSQDDGFRIQHAWASGSVLSVVHGNAFALRHDIRLQGPHLGTIGFQLGATHRVLDTPVDHVAQQNDAAQLYLELGISLRVRVGRVGMAHVAGNGDRAAQLVGAVEDPRTFRGELLRFPRPSQKVALGEVAVGVAIRLGRP